MGVSSGGDSITYAALPVLDHDTLAFWPLPLTELSTNRGQLPSGLMLDAIRRNRAMMRRVAEEWVRRAPQDPAAYDSLATWVEVSGGVATVGEAQLSTSDVVRRALQLASDSSERIHLGVSTVRLLVKDGKFAAARIMAESLLAAGAGIHTPYVPGVAGLAALIGHIDEAARLLALDPENTAVTGPRGIRTPLPRQVSQAAGRYLPGHSPSRIRWAVSCFEQSHRGTIHSSSLSRSSSTTTSPALSACCATCNAETGSASL